ncbi:hypothetical protein TWF281_009060 [Arthrobotrys megalospora]
MDNSAEGHLEDAVGGTAHTPTDSYNEDGLTEYSNDEFDTFGRKVRKEAPPAGSYPHPLDGRSSWADALTFKETYVRAFSASVRDKPNWTEKILDRELFAKWLREAQAKDPLSDGHRVLTWDADDVACVHEELVDAYRPFVEDLRAQGLNLEPDIDGVWRSDDFIDEELRLQLINAVATLENVPENQKDWHPGSNKQVLDLVHPSLWPIVYGRSVSLPNGEAVRVPEGMKNDEDGFSDKFCWLPSEFEVSPDGKETKINSYINNLASQKQKALFYPILEKIFTKFVPLFNHVLGDLRMKKHNFKRVFAIAGRRWWRDDLIMLSNENHKLKWDKLLDQFVKGEDMDVNFLEALPHQSGRFDPDDLGDPEFEGCDDSEDEFSAGDTDFYEVRDNTGRYFPSIWEPPKITDEIKLEGKTVKVIVKLANIVLTPENPRYKGGSWHVEAMLNERIVSTGICYYDQDNITDSKLAFRRTVGNVPNVHNTVQMIEQYSDWPIIFNMSSDYQASAVQEIGRIATKEKRAIAFPNIYQHQVRSFRLADPTKPGYRKILVFFLCDPSPGHELPTTKTVAPQQPEFRAKVEDMLREGPMSQVPEEIFRMINELVPPVVTQEEALKYRKELMRERASFTNNTTMVQGLCYSLCEH